MKSEKIFEDVKFVLLVLSFCTILIGWGMNIEILVIIGSLCFVANLLINLILIVKLSINYKKEIDIVKLVEYKIKKFNSWIENALMVLGLIAILVGKPSYIVAFGGLIWGSTFVLYFFSGIVAKIITELPIKMTHGGWAIRQKRKRK